MTDQEWCIQRRLAKNIFKSYGEWKDAKGVEKYKAEKALCRDLALRGTEESSPGPKPGLEEALVVILVMLPIQIVIGSIFVILKEFFF